mmetsp:Transcript_137472/g.342934  ORF Transcript_137472/g.342934 Transcript_137472/m.342934 type:complete len:746 (+) Transcript_137472:62-2299(+)
MTHAAWSALLLLTALHAAHSLTTKTDRSSDSSTHTRAALVTLPADYWEKYDKHGGDTCEPPLSGSELLASTDMFAVFANFINTGAETFLASYSSARKISDPPGIRVPTDSNSVIFDTCGLMRAVDDGCFTLSQGTSAPSLHSYYETFETYEQEINRYYLSSTTAEFSSATASLSAAYENERESRSGFASSAFVSVMQNTLQDLLATLTFSTRCRVRDYVKPTIKQQFEEFVFGGYTAEALAVDPGFFEFVLGPRGTGLFLARQWEFAVSSTIEVSTTITEVATSDYQKVRESIEVAAGATYAGVETSISQEVTNQIETSTDTSRSEISVVTRITQTIPHPCPLPDTENTAQALRSCRQQVVNQPGTWDDKPSKVVKDEFDELPQLFGAGTNHAIYTALERHFTPCSAKLDCASCLRTQPLGPTEALVCAWQPINGVQGRCFAVHPSSNGLEGFVAGTMPSASKVSQVCQKANSIPPRYINPVEAHFQNTEVLRPMWNQRAENTQSLCPEGQFVTQLCSAQDRNAKDDGCGPTRRQTNSVHWVQCGIAGPVTPYAHDPDVYIAVKGGPTHRNMMRCPTGHAMVGQCVTGGNGKRKEQKCILPDHGVQGDYAPGTAVIAYIRCRRMLGLLAKHATVLDSENNRRELTGLIEFTQFKARTAHGEGGNRRGIVAPCTGTSRSRTEVARPSTLAVVIAMCGSAGSDHNPDRGFQCDFTPTGGAVANDYAMTQCAYLGQSEYEFGTSLASR